jgi:hypothetical protein
MRASKLPYRNFENNIRRAEALANLDGYLEDLVNNEGKGTLNSLTKIPNEMMQVFGFERIMEKVTETLKKEMEIEIQNKGKENLEQWGKDYFKKFEPKLLKLVTIVEDLGLLMDQTLLEQALIAAVSAFEFYIREVIVSIIKLNSRVRKKFIPEINKAIDAQKLEAYGNDAKRVQGEIVANLIKLDVNNMKGFFAKLLDVQNVFTDEKTERKVIKILQIRHLIIHRAGVVDPKYKKITKSRKSVDAQIRISRRIVLNFIKTLRNLAKGIESNIN